MKQEFITLYGKVYIERNVLYFRNHYLPFSETAFAQIGWQFLWIFLFATQFFREGPRKYIGVLLFGLLVLFRIPDIIDKLFKRSYTSRLPLSKIKEVKIENDHQGLQTNLHLCLQNGRYKEVIFRNMENQLEPFMEALSVPSMSVEAA